VTSAVAGYAISMRRVALLALLGPAALASAAGASLVVPAPGAPPPPPCRRGDDRVVALSREVAVLRRGPVLIACDRLTGGRRLIYRPGRAFPNELAGARLVTVSGGTIAYATYRVCTVCGGESPDVLHVTHGDAGHGRLRRTGGRVRAIALNECGTVAYVQDRALRLWAGDEDALLDPRPVEVRSLRVSDARVVWRREGVVHARDLPVGCAHAA
jgi:hypothetical protein